MADEKEMRKVEFVFDERSIDSIERIEAQGHSVSGKEKGPLLTAPSESSGSEETKTGSQSQVDSSTECTCDEPDDSACPRHHRENELQGELSRLQAEAERLRGEKINGLEELSHKQDTIDDLREEVASLKGVVAESNEVCLCGCPADAHENYGEDGESCGNDAHECIRTCRAIAGIVASLKKQLGEMESERNVARGLMIQSDETVEKLRQSLGFSKVAGLMIEGTIGEFRLSCERHIEEEQQKILPDTALIATLCDAVRLTREIDGLASGQYLEEKSQRISELEKQLEQARECGRELAAALKNMTQEYVDTIGDCGDIPCKHPDCALVKAARVAIVNAQKGQTDVASKDGALIEASLKSELREEQP